MIQIKHRFLGRTRGAYLGDANLLKRVTETTPSGVLFEKDTTSLKLCVEAAVESSANLRGAYLGDANLHGANLGGVNLGNAYLGDANLRDANLGGANLRDANLHGANLHGANLRDANLRDANLHGANLYGANLRDANLGGADLRDAVGVIFISGVANCYGWDIIITSTHMGIGCEWHSPEGWAGFDDRRIIAMDRKALKFWRRNREWLLACAATMKDVKE